MHRSWNMSGKIGRPDEVDKYSLELGYLDLSIVFWPAIIFFFFFLAPEVGNFGTLDFAITTSD